MFESCRARQGRYSLGDGSRPSPRRMKRTLARFGLLLLGVVLALVLGEGVARLLWPSSSQQAGERPQAYTDLPEIRTLTDFARRNARGRMSCGALYRTNRAGFRGPEYANTKPPGTFRVAIGGDSITMGYCVEEHETYAALLEEALNAQGPEGHRYEVLNLGLPGLDIHGVVPRTRKKALRFESDMIVYGWTINDIEGPAYQRYDLPEARSKRIADYQRFSDSPSYLLREVWSRWCSLRDTLRPPRGSYQHEVVANYLQNEAAWSDFASELDELAQIQAERDICVIVLLHTDLHYLNFLHPYQAIYDRVVEAADDRGLHSIGSFEVHRGHRAHALRVGELDAHPNAAGHRLLARALFDGLEKIPRRCWD
jgi:lysophospholipase L1-like esterase